MLRSAMALLALIGLFSAPAFSLEKFTTEAEAAGYCQGDVVLWLDLRTKTWYYKGQRLYGNTKQGAYVCQKEAEAAGARAMRSGD